MGIRRLWLKDLRQSNNFTHEKLAMLSGIKRAYYTQIENGNRNPGVKTAQRIASVLGFNWIRFFE